MALAVMLSFVCYLRPGAAPGAAPSRRRAAVPDAGFLFHDAALGRPGKTGLVDEAVLVDKDPWL
eukprot:2847359-Lingulodinium_polyedra.AAC.1